MNDEEKREYRIEVIKEHMTDIMQVLGMDLSDPSLKDTPARVARMYVDELFQGMLTSPPRVTVFPNEYAYDQIVSLTNISCYSLCEHHFLPFPMKIHIGYIPGDKVVGLSKLARIAKHFSRRPQVQERLTKQIADFIEKELQPKGVIVVIEGQHMCMSMRGVENEHATMLTSDIRGAFKDNGMEAKFIEIIKVSRRT